MLNSHPCLHTSAQPHKRMGAITTKETYYFTSTKVDKDARQFLVPWMGYGNASFALSDAAWQGIDGSWFDKAQALADRGTTLDAHEYFRARSYTAPIKKLSMQPCKEHYILEGAVGLATPLAPRPCTIWFVQMASRLSVYMQCCVQRWHVQGMDVAQRRCACSTVLSHLFAKSVLLAAVPHNLLFVQQLRTTCTRPSLRRACAACSQMRLPLQRSRSQYGACDLRITNSEATSEANARRAGLQLGAQYFGTTS